MIARRWLALALLMTLLSACSVAAISSLGARRSNTEEVDLEQDLRPPPRSEVAEIVERVLPSVVNLKVRTPNGEGEGSGVIIDPEGVILTNNHVVQNSVSVEIFFNDGQEPAEGTVVGGIPERDLAVIEVDATDLDAVSIGSSDRLRLGDEVVAIGYPLGLGGPTVTRGIISGKTRTIETEVQVGNEPVAVELEGLLQTDAAINPGNSGGALLDAAGRLVGVNTAVAGFAENIGFAIAIDDALPTIEEIMSEPRDEHAWLGVGTQRLDANVAVQLGIDPDTEGVVVENVFADTPAREAGIEAGDVITSVSGESIESPADLSEVITRHDPGDEVEIEIVTPDGTETIDVRLDRRPVTLPLG
jgi:S1-C subfamily serine protease